MKKFIILLVVVGILLLLGIPQTLFKKNIINNISDESAKRASLEEMYYKITEMDKTNNYEDFYEYLTPSEKSKITKEELLNKTSTVDADASRDFIIHSINIDGDRGIIDRTLIVCITTPCDEKDKIVTRVKKEYFYINGNWYQELDNNVFCDRKSEYYYPDEFKRAVSLLLQRREQSTLAESTDLAKKYQRIRNCLNIQYAESEELMEGAEGFFSFSDDSDIEKLDIFVSPKYKLKDDLLTALLLSHEIHHAYLFVTGRSQIIDCYENEAEAFAWELGLFEFDLNDEERSSIINRYGSSPEIKDFLDLRELTIQQEGINIDDKVLPIIKADSFYKRQCASE